jgi:hypothetical protein
MWRSEVAPTGEMNRDHQHPTSVVRSIIANCHHDLGRPEILNSWRRAVLMYSACDLTFDNDKLPALSGIAKTYQHALKDEYLAGLWRSDIGNQLMWRVLEPGTRTDGYAAPSWSWASLRGCTINLPTHMLYETLIIDLLSVNTTLEGDDVTGRVVDGSLIVKARLTPITEIREKIGCYLFSTRNNQSQPKILANWDVSGSVQIGPASKKHKLFCMPIRLWWNSPERKSKLSDDLYIEGLILEEENAEKLEFHRCGTFSVQGGVKSPDDTRIWDIWHSFDGFDDSSASASLKPEYWDDERGSLQYNGESWRYEFISHVKRYTITIK